VPVMAGVPLRKAEWRKKIFSRAKINAGVRPVLNKAVQVFKEPPEPGALLETEQKARGPRRASRFLFPEREAVNLRM